MDDHEKTLKQCLNLPVSSCNLLLFQYLEFRRGLDKVKEEQHLNNDIGIHGLNIG